MMVKLRIQLQRVGDSGTGLMFKSRCGTNGLNVMIGSVDYVRLNVRVRYTCALVVSCI